MKLKNSLKQNSRALRSNMTYEERELWYKFLKFLPVTVHRQKVIGPYIVDFYCAAKKLVIEVDGRQHYEGDIAVSDEIRDSYLTENGYTVVRFKNYEIRKDFRNVRSKISGLLEIDENL